MHIPIDYATLRIIWWILLGVLLIVFAVMDGFDLGIGMLLHRVAHTNEERRLVLNTIGPIWEGNQIWLILGAGAIFAAWPEIYAVAFSGFYFMMLLILLALILRPVGFKYRSKVENSHWRAFWDSCLFINGFIPALLFGVVLGNVLQGVPFYYDQTMRSFYTGTFFGLLNPYALLCGLVSVSMLAMHGACFLAIKTNGIIQQRAIHYIYCFGVLTLCVFAIAGIWLYTHIPGFVLQSTLATDIATNPLQKHVIMQLGAFFTNYNHYPITKVVPLCGLFGILLAMLFTALHHYKMAWCMSAASIAGIITTVGVSMFPFILPSSIQPNASLLVWDASSSQLTLFIMLIATTLFLPLIVLYTSWVYYVLRGKVTSEYIEQHKHHLY